MGITIPRVQRGDTYAGYTDLKVMCCPICGVLYAAPEVMLDKARKDPDVGWCCINGHSLHFPGKTPEQKVKDAEDELARERAWHDQTRASLIAQRGATTRVRNEKARLIARVANGVCPCCNRTFKQLAAHMANKHPDYVDRQEAT